MNSECEHKWKNNSGSNDKPSIHCNRYPVLKLRYQCKNCLVECCKFCLEKSVTLPLPEPVVNTNIRAQTLELRIISLENRLEQLRVEFDKLIHQLKIRNLIDNEQYAKLGSTGQKQFNIEDARQIEKIKLVKEIPDLKLPLENDYLIIETNGCELGWGAVLKRKPNKYSSRVEEEICRYSSGQFNEIGLTSSIDQEILAASYGLDSFRLFLLNKKEILVRIDCEAIIKFFEKSNSKRISQRRWLALKDRIVNSACIVGFEHIKGSDNSLADKLSRCLFEHQVVEAPP